MNNLLFSIPEALVVISLATILAGSKFIWKNILTIGFMVGFLSHLWRLAISNYILNIIIYTLILVAFLTYFKIANDLFERIVCVMMAICIYLMTEFINLKVFEIIYGLDPLAMFGQPVLRYICFLQQILIVLLICYLLAYFKLSIFTETRGYHEEF